MTPLLRLGTLGIGGTVATVAIFFTSIIGGNYQGLILNHLASIVQGGNTRTVVATNAPNWGYAIPLATPQIGSVATTTGGSLASSTPISFEVAALDGDGTTTVSVPATLTTDAPSATLGAEAVNLSWSPVTGAQGYAIFVSTTTPASYNTYWVATSTNGVPNTTYTYTSTSTPLSGSYTKDDTTAFSNRIMGDGSKSFLNAGPIGIGTSTPASSTPMDVNGYMRAGRNGTSTACEADTAGVVFYNTANSHEWGCNGSTWTKIF
jgi:hypothetical protein